MGLSSLHDTVTFRGGTLATTGVAPESLEECVHSWKDFCVERLVREAFVSAGLNIISAGLGNVKHAYWRSLTIGYVRKV
jgi:hypothetical protein